MNLKEAGRYSNFLSNQISTLSSLPNQEAYLFKVKEEHLKNVSNIEAQDETIDKIFDKNIEIDLQDAMHLTVFLIKERAKLALAIEKAKSKMFIDWEEDNQKLSLDSAVSYNKQIRSLADYQLKKLVNLKQSEVENRGTGYRINAEGNQTPYYYTVKTTKTIAYDKNVVKQLYKKLLTSSDKISKLIDEEMTKDTINFNPTFDVNDSIEDIIERYISLKNKK